MEQLGPEEAQRRYGPNWQEVVEYIEAIPYGFLLNSAGEPNPRDAAVRRIRSQQELEEVTYFGDDCPDEHTSRYLRYLMNIGLQSCAIERLARERGLAQELKNAWEDAGEQFVDSFQGHPEWFYNWEDQIDGMRAEWYRRQFQDDAWRIAAAMVLGRCPQTEVFYEMWYWYRVGHWPCGWEGEWPEGRLIVY